MVCLGDLKAWGREQGFRTLASSQGEFPLCMMCQILYIPFMLTWDWIISLQCFIWLVVLWKVWSVTAECYVSMLDISRALSQTLFGDQRCWKNFSLWRKQTAHWLCSLLSGCINRPPTSFSGPLLSPSETVHIQTRSSSDCRRTLGNTHWHQTPFPLSFMRPNKHTLHAEWWTTEVASDLCFTFCKQHRGVEIPFSQQLCVKPPFGMCSDHRRAEVNLTLRWVRGVGGWICGRGQNLQLWSQIAAWGKNRAPCFLKGTWWEWRLSATKAEELLSSAAAGKRDSQWPCSQITVYLIFHGFSVELCTLAKGLTSNASFF